MYRGVFRTEGGFFRVCDPAGFFRFETVPENPSMLTVKPPEETGETAVVPLRTGGEPLSRSRKKTRNDLLIESRRYLPGDDVRLINWKAFAHLRELLIRIGEEVPDPDSMIYIYPDLSAEFPEATDPDLFNEYLEYYVSYIKRLTAFLKSKNLQYTLAGAADEDEILSGLWWNDFPGFDETIKGSILLVSSAFSTLAPEICLKAASGNINLKSVIIRRAADSGIITGNTFEVAAFAKKLIFRMPPESSVKNRVETILLGQSRDLESRLKKTGRGVEIEVI